MSFCAELIPNQDLVKAIIVLRMGTPTQENNLLTDSSWWIRRIPSASKAATDCTLIFGNCFSGGSGIESVITTSLIGASRNLSMALPQRTPCVAST